MATSVSFGWRYDRNGKAAELSVTNDDALTKSGEQIVTFIPQLIGISNMAGRVIHHHINLNLAIKLGFGW